MTAPFGRRLCKVSENRPSGGYQVFSLLDEEGPQPEAGQFYMLATEDHWEQRSQRPYLPRAISVADAGRAVTSPLVAHSATKGELSDVRLDFLIEGVGPGTDRLCGLEPGENVWVNGPLGNAFAPPREIAPNAAGAILVGGGIGIAPLALLRRRFAEKNVPTRVLLGFRDATHSGGLDDLFACCEVRLASEDGHVGHRGYVTDLLAAMLEGDDSGSAAVYSCGPPAMLDAVTSGELPASWRWSHRWRAAMAPASAARFPRAVVATCASASTAPSSVAIRLRRSMVDFCGIELEHPVINASGTFDAIAAGRVYGEALLERFPFSAFVSKTITPEPRVGNDPQRIWETPAGMINSIGLPNKGLEGFLANDLPELARLPVPLIVSVMGTSREEFTRLVTNVGARDEVAAMELNVSCPNVHSGLIVGEQPGETAALVEALRPLTRKPLIVKLTPNVADPAAVAVAAEQGGADAVSLINTMKASAIDPATGSPGIAAGHGGLSGPAVRPIAIAQVRAVAAAVSIPIVGMGGVATGADALEFIAAGATLVAVGTENFRDPRAGERVAGEIAGALEASQSGTPLRPGG
jgi:dihydroorotate dehydrogenase (NAD+) catalytic subunit